MPIMYVNSYPRRLFNIVFIGYDDYLYKGTDYVQSPDNITYLTFYTFSMNVIYMCLNNSSNSFSILLINIFPSANFKFKIAIFIPFLRKTCWFLTLLVITLYDGCSM